MFGKKDNQYLRNSFTPMGKPHLLKTT